MTSLNEIIPKCKECEIYYGNVDWNGLCSECCGVTKPALKVIGACIDLYEKGVLCVTERKFDCGVCFEKKQMAKMFPCHCNFNFCADCLLALNKCPTCRASKCIKLDKYDICEYVHHSNKLVWISKMIAKHKHHGSGIITFNTFYCDTITYVKAIDMLRKFRKMTFDGFDMNIYVAQVLVIIVNCSMYRELKKIGIKRLEGDCLDAHFTSTDKLDVLNKLINRFHAYKDFKYEIGVDDV